MMQAAANSAAGIIGLVIFVTFWSFVALMLLGRRAREQANEHALIPFKDGNDD